MIWNQNQNRLYVSDFKSKSPAKWFKAMKIKITPNTEKHKFDIKIFCSIMQTVSTTTNELYA